MPTYTRAYIPGGTFFFTLVAYNRRPILAQALVRSALRRAIQKVRVTRPFRIEALALLPDHLHTIWTLPPEDTDFSTRWRLIKTHTTHQRLQSPLIQIEQSLSRRKKGEQVVWQRRFWEHRVRSEEEFSILCDYIHYNPVKHGHVSCSHAWPFSSFQRLAAGGHYAADWLCICNSPLRPEPDLQGVQGVRVKDVVGE